jgi:hypothetical protein
VKRPAIVAVMLTLVLAMGASTRGAAQPPPPPATVFQACSVAHPGSIAVTFAWPPTPGALQQWVDLTLFDNGFQPGTFLGAGPVVTGTNTFTWDGIVPGLRHFYRVNMLYPDGWVAVASGSFVSIGGCPKPTASLGAATNTRCNRDFADLTFTWTPGGGDSQWLDIAESPEAMALDTYHAQGPLSPDTYSFSLRLPTDTSYWWRVNTHSAAGWSPSAVSSFAGVHCGPEVGTAAPASLGSR